MKNNFVRGKSIKTFIRVLLIVIVLDCSGVTAAKSKEPVLMLKIHGLYCKTNFSGVKVRILRLSGVSKVHVFFKDSMVAVYLEDSNSKALYSEIRMAVKQSTYQLKGMWLCRKPTLQLSTCRKNF